MTKEIAPLTVENAIDKAIGDLTIEVAMAQTGRTKGYLRSLTDPLKRPTLTVMDMIKLSVATRERGLGTPIWDVVAAMIRSVDAQYFAGPAAIGLATMDVIREGSDAHIAMCEISQPGATDKQLLFTLRELEESSLATSRAIDLVRAQLAQRQPP